MHPHSLAVTSDGIILATTQLAVRSMFSCGCAQQLRCPSALGVVFPFHHITLPSPPNSPHLPFRRNGENPAGTVIGPFSLLAVKPMLKKMDGDGSRGGEGGKGGE